MQDLLVSALKPEELLAGHTNSLCIFYILRFLRRVFVWVSTVIKPILISIFFLGNASGSSAYSAFADVRLENKAFLPQAHTGGNKLFVLNDPALMALLSRNVGGSVILAAYAYTKIGYQEMRICGAEELKSRHKITREWKNEWFNMITAELEKDIRALGAEPIPLNINSATKSRSRGS
jgi:hypothetical protein